MGDAGGCSLGIAIEDPDRVSVPSNASAAAAGTVAEPSSAPPAAHARAVEAAPIKSENLQTRRERTANRSLSGASPKSEIIMYMINVTHSLLILRVSSTRKGI